MQPIDLEKYFYPDSHTLLNHFGITDQDALAMATAGVVAAQLSTLPVADLPETRDAAELCAIHSHLYGSIFEWAGSFRIWGGCQCFPSPDHGSTCENKPFPWWDIDDALDKLTEDLASENYLKDLSTADFRLRYNAYWKRLIRIDPFLIGTEPTIRVFLHRIATAAGHNIN